MTSAAASAIEVHGLRKRFGDVTALDGLDLRVQAGTVFGLLGPNGAGKTTLLRIVATLLKPDTGRAEVLGHDVVTEPLAVRRRIGLAGQFAAVDGELTGRENVEMIGRLYRLSGAEARTRAGEVLERFDRVHLVFPLVFASSAFVPTAKMPGVVHAFADVNPVTLVVNAARALTIGHGQALAPALGALAWLAALLLIFVPLAVRAFRQA